MNEKIMKLDQAIKDDPNNPNCYLERAQAYFNLEEYRKCIEDCKQAIALDSDNVEAYVLLSHSHNELKEYDEAITMAERAIALDAKNSSAYRVRGVSYRGKKEHMKALADLNKAIELNENNTRAYNSRGILHSDLKENDKALADYNKAIELDESNAIFYNNRGILYHDLKENDKALADYNKAIELDENDTVIYNNRGILYYDLKENDKALADYNKAIELDENNANFYNNRGISHRDLKENDKALADYNKAIELDKNYVLAYRNLASYYHEVEHNYKKALKNFEKSRELYIKEDNSFMVRWLDGRIKEVKGLLSKPIPETEKAKMVMDEIEEARMEEEIRETKKSFNEFIEEKNSSSSALKDETQFAVLRRWNSYTPIIADNYRISKGGGYFFQIPGCGVVIDPGFNFIDNFKTAGFKFHQIDHILITHAHNDHTADLESILTLLHQYNEAILGDYYAPEENTIMSEVYLELGEPPDDGDDKHRKRYVEMAKEKLSQSPRYKRIRIYMTASTHKKYAPMLDLRKDADYDVEVIKAEEKLLITHPNSSDAEHAKDLEITAIPAKHDDMFSEAHSIGFIVCYKDFVLVYTGDTGFNNKMEKRYKKIANDYKDYKITLLAHLGGFKSYENGFDASMGFRENEQCFYKNHLGRLGLARAVEILEPEVCIISEFGEEFRHNRIKLAEIFNKVFGDVTAFLPADIGLTLDMAGKVQLIDIINRKNEKTEGSFYAYSDALVCEHKPSNALHYYNKHRVKEADLREFLTMLYIRSIILDA